MHYASFLNTCVLSIFTIGNCLFGLSSFSLQSFIALFMKHDWRKQCYQQIVFLRKISQNLEYNFSGVFDIDIVKSLQIVFKIQSFSIALVFFDIFKKFLIDIYLQ